MNYNKIWMDLVDSECYTTDYLFCVELDAQIYWDGQMIFNDIMDEQLPITYEEFKTYLVNHEWLVFSQTPLKIMYAENID